MTRTTRTLAKITTLALLLLLAPASVASESTTISTGEVHTYNTPDDTHTACPRAITTWTVTLTLTDPSDADAVALSVESLGGAPPAGGGVATSLDPQVEVTVTQGHGCRPPAQVTGIVADDTPYDLSFTNDGGLPL